MNFIKIINISPIPARRKYTYMDKLPFPVAGVSKKLASTPAAGFLVASRGMSHRDFLSRDTRQFGIPVTRRGNQTDIGGTSALPTENLTEPAQWMETTLLWFCRKERTKTLLKYLSPIKYCTILSTV